MEFLDSSEQELLDKLSKVGTPGLASGVPTHILGVGTLIPRIRVPTGTHILLGSIELRGCFQS